MTVTELLQMSLIHSGGVVNDRLLHGLTSAIRAQGIKVLRSKVEVTVDGSCSSAEKVRNILMPGKDSNYQFVAPIEDQASGSTFYFSADESGFQIHIAQITDNEDFHKPYSINLETFASHSGGLLTADDVLLIIKIHFGCISHITVK